MAKQRLITKSPRKTASDVPSSLAEAMQRGWQEIGAEEILERSGPGRNQRRESGVIDFYPPKASLDEPSPLVLEIPFKCVMTFGHPRLRRMRRADGKWVG
ncbi:MAG: hypothetical protein ACRD19_07290 [Terriglobia bacterium]